MRRAMPFLLLAPLVCVIGLVGCSSINQAVNPNARPLAQIPADLNSCAAAALPDVSSQYDPVTDSTTAFVGRLSLGDAFSKMWRLETQAKHAGRAASATVAPRLWVKTETSLTAYSPNMQVLVDDSLRFTWRLAGDGFGSVQGLFGRTEERYYAYTPTSTDYARFAAGKKATLVVGELRQDLAERQLRRFAEMYLWAQCPALRSPPAVVK